MIDTERNEREILAGKVCTCFPVTDPFFKARCAREWFNGYARMEGDEPPGSVEYRSIEVE
ncbi:MAG: hypothetical protein ACLFPW_14310 [Spirochaetaceae bacterium]